MNRSAGACAADQRPFLEPNPSGGAASAFGPRSRPRPEGTQVAAALVVGNLARNQRGRADRALYTAKTDGPVVIDGSVDAPRAAG